MTIRLSGDGIAQTIAGSTTRVAWNEVRLITAENVDHMTQRVAMLTIDADSAETIELHEGSPGWDEVVQTLAAYLTLGVPDLDAAVSLLRSGETIVVFSR